jgi:hypothetical protein
MAYKGISVNIAGLDKLEARLKVLDGIPKRIDREMTASAQNINAEQVARTPVDHGVLRQGNRFDVSKPLQKRIFNIVEYSPYVEFGTGTYVDVPPGLEDVAIQFKGRGIRQVNIHPQPFFFAPFFEEQKRLIERIRKIITSA